GPGGQGAAAWGGERGGGFRAGGRTASNAAAARRQRASWCQGATICRATGSPSAVNPQGTDAAGQPVRLNGYIRGQRPPATCCTGVPSISAGGCWYDQAGQGMAGGSRRS